MQKIIPAKLKKGDLIRIIAPSRSLQLIEKEIRMIADKRLKKMGLNLSFGKHVDEKDDFISSSIKSRIADLHDAFADESVKAILTVIGGFNSNQLLQYIDWDLIKNNPKILCGYSDITALNNAIFAKTGLITYSGLHYSTFGQKLHFDYSLDYFNEAPRPTSCDGVSSKSYGEQNPAEAENNFSHSSTGNSFLWFSAKEDKNT